MIENQYDTNKLYAQEGVPRTGPFDATWLGYVRMYGEAMRDSTLQVLSFTSHVEGRRRPLPSVVPPARRDDSRGARWRVVHRGGERLVLGPPGKLAAKYKQVEQCSMSFDGLPCNLLTQLPRSPRRGPRRRGQVERFTTWAVAHAPVPAESYRKTACIAVEAGEQCLDCTSMRRPSPPRAAPWSAINEVCSQAPCIVALGKAGCAGRMVSLASRSSRTSAAARASSVPRPTRELAKARVHQQVDADALQGDLRSRLTSISQCAHEMRWTAGVATSDCDGVGPWSRVWWVRGRAHGQGRLSGRPHPRACVCTITVRYCELAFDWHVGQESYL